MTNINQATEHIANLSAVIFNRWQQILDELSHEEYEQFISKNDMVFHVEETKRHLTNIVDAIDFALDGTTYDYTAE